MQQFQRYYKSGTCTIQNRFPQGVTSTNTISHKYSFSKPKSKAEAKQVAAKKHSEAERRRRMRINGQYATLRDILPNLVKVSTKIHTNSNFINSFSSIFIISNIKTCKNQSGKLQLE